MKKIVKFVKECMKTCGGQVTSGAEATRSIVRSVMADSTAYFGHRKRVNI